MTSEGVATITEACEDIRAEIGYLLSKERPACAKCLKFPREHGSVMCWGCADTKQQIAAAHRRGDPIQK